MIFKKKISKKIWMRLAIFVAVIGVATLFDVYFENNSETLKEIEAESTNNTNSQSKIYFVSQTNSFDLKASAEKDAGRKTPFKSHDKFIRKYHQLRNFQVLKAEVKTQTTPLILAYHYLAFRNYFFTHPDDEPPVS